MDCLIGKLDFIAGNEWRLGPIQIAAAPAERKTLADNHHRVNAPRHRHRIVGFDQFNSLRIEVVTRQPQNINGASGRLPIVVIK